MQSVGFRGGQIIMATKQKRVRGHLRKIPGSSKKVRVAGHLRKKRTDIKKPGKGR